MSGLDWLVVGIGPFVVLGVVSKYALRHFREHRQKQQDRIEHLGARLHQQLRQQSAESDLVLSNNASQKILQSLRESERRMDAVDSIAFSSIDPVQESVVIVSERLADLDAQLRDENDLASLSLVALAVIYARSHVTETIRVEEMAKTLRVSRIRLNSFLNQTLGCSAQVLITVIKMQEAKRLLKQGDLLVKQVAFRLGYMNPYHFSARFKLFFGVSPSFFQKHYQRQIPPRADNSDSSDIGQAEDPQSSRQVEQLPTPGDHAGQLAPGSTDDFIALPEGTKIDRFLIVSLIGQGGMGVVYKAYDPKLNRGVALKVIRTDRARSIHSQNRLLREAQALARLSHPNVLHVYDVGTFGEQVFIAMALVEGQTLNQWLSQDRPVNDILKVMIAAGQGLSAAHKAGLVHRDFKPGNVIVGNDGQVRVLDFGLARAVAADSAQEDDEQPQDFNSAQDRDELSSGSLSNLLLTPLTRAGQVVGTPLYMAPEQYLGIDADERADLFSFCVVLYEALYRKRPFVGTTISDLKNEVIRDQVRKPTIDSVVPDWLWQIMRKGLTADPKKRYGNMDALLEDLRNDPQERQRQMRLERKRKRFLVLVILLAIILPIGVWFGLRYRTVQRCKNAQHEFSGIWDEVAKTLVQTAFLNINKTYAQWTWERVEQTIDQYLAEWNKMRSDVCEAKLLRSTLSEELFDLQMNCLQSRRLELQALVSVFTQADDQVVRNAVQASSALTGIVRCADEKSLRAPYPPPKNPENRVKVKTIRDKLNQVAALEKTGRYQAGLELVQQLETDANALDYRPVQAEVGYLHGLLLEKMGDYKRAETVFRNAAKAAAESGDASIVARALSWIVWEVGYRQARHEEGLLIAQDAEVVIGFVKNDDSIRTHFLHRLGTVYWDQEQYQKALDYYRKALAISKKLVGTNHPEVATLLNSMGLIFASLGMPDKTQQTYQEALTIMEKTLGPEHPNVAVVLSNIARNLESRGHYTKAAEYLRRALDIDRKALGAEHPELAHTLHLLGVISWKAGHTNSALAHLNRSLTIWEKTLGPNHPYVAYPLDSLGFIFLKQGLYNKAAAYFTRALELREKALGTENAKLADSLSGIGIILVNQKKLRQGLETLIRAVRLCNFATCPASAFFALAKAMAATKNDKEGSIKFAKQARDRFRKAPKLYKNELKEVGDWLKQRGIE